MSKNLSRKTVERLNKVKEAILDNPTFYYQNTFVESMSVCGSTCCIAGWADYIANGAKAHNERANHYFNWVIGISRGKLPDWKKIGSEALGISRDLSAKLFDASDYWPKPYCEQYQNAKTSKGRARIAANRIDHFIATNGME